MYLQLTALTIWLSRQAIDEAMSPEFVEKYQSTRVLLDATEIWCEVPSSFVTQSGLYSHYKSTHMLKGLIGVSPDGDLLPLSLSCSLEAPQTENVSEEVGFWT